MIDSMSQALNTGYNTHNKNVTIYEAIIVSQSTEGVPHIAPFGIRRQQDIVLIAPFQPSTTLQNMQDTQTATVNFTDDVRIFAGAIVGRRDWRLTSASKLNGQRLVDSLAHAELQLVEIEEDALRPKLFFKVIHEETHHPFGGFNRAQAAVIELAVLASRLHLLPQDKIKNEMMYLQIAIDKTAGEREQQAWQWLQEHIQNWYATQAGENIA